jgi:hypothetical protein
VARSWEIWRQEMAEALAKSGYEAGSARGGAKEESFKEGGVNGARQRMGGEGRAVNRGALTVIFWGIEKGGTP